eukprot:gene28930-35885_t
MDTFCEGDLVCLKCGGSEIEVLSIVEAYPFDEGPAPAVICMCVGKLPHRTGFSALCAGAGARRAPTIRAAASPALAQRFLRPAGASSGRAVTSARVPTLPQHAEFTCLRGGSRHLPRSPTALDIGPMLLNCADPGPNGVLMLKFSFELEGYMIWGHETHYEGWTIYTSVREDKPEGWRQGDAIAYAATATATPEGAAIRSGFWSSLLEQKLPPVGERAFDDHQLGHKTLLGEMRGLIESLRK